MVTPSPELLVPHDLHSTSCLAKMSSYESEMACRLNWSSRLLNLAAEMRSSPMGCMFGAVAASCNRKRRHFPLAYTDRISLNVRFQRFLQLQPTDLVWCQIPGLMPRLQGCQPRVRGLWLRLFVSGRWRKQRGWPPFALSPQPPCPCNPLLQGSVLILVGAMPPVISSDRSQVSANNRKRNGDR